ncbi:Uncharacterised protein [Mycobacteroides abscessus subsp. abscessus]|nr:Uncharacterised protein [Mycobacteroides abscessus subsp. abscessus]
MSAPWACSDRPNAATAPPSSKSAARLRGSVLALCHTGPRPSTVTCHGYQ